MNRRTFFAAIVGSIAGAKARMLGAFRSERICPECKGFERLTAEWEKGCVTIRKIPCATCANLGHIGGISDQLRCGPVSIANLPDLRSAAAKDSREAEIHRIFYRANRTTTSVS